MTYAAVHARPDGDSTVARLAQTAAEYGYEGLVVRNHGDSPASYDPDAIAEAVEVDIVAAVEVRAGDQSSASGFIRSHRADHAIVAVHGGETAMNRFAVEQTAVDVLAHPMRGEGDLNHVIARKARNNGVRLEVDLSPLIHEAGGKRVRAVGDLRKLRELIEAYNVPFVVSADATDHVALRSPRDLIAVCQQLGFSAEQAETGLTEWGRLADRNRKRQSDRYVEPGVWRNTDQS